MKSFLIKVAQSIVKTFGGKVVRLHDERNEASRVVMVAEKLGVKCILDVGANTGQFAEELFNYRWHNQVISVEPLSIEHEKLKSKSVANSNWKIAKRCAAGEKQGESKIFRSGNSVSSSLLPIRDEYMSTTEGLQTIGSETVEICRLDELEIIPKDAPLFLKIDAQGFEMSALRGAEGLFPRIKGILVEVSFVKIYDNQPLIFEIFDYLDKNQFKAHDIIPCFYHPDTGQMLQANAIFVR